MPAEESDVALGASYRLVELIGRGASGEVWRGVDRRTGETVAAKLLRAEHVEDSGLVERFLRERSILTRLRDDNVVTVRDLVVEGDRLAIVMEYVGGGSLRQTLQGETPLPPGLAVGVVAAVLTGLAAAHDIQVLHRDVKPDNVLLTPQWRELVPGAIKVSDFGIARIIADRAGTSTGLIGTPEYMAPEQLVTGAGDLPADVYGAGILLYELMAGRTPYAGPGTGYTVAHRHMTSLLPRLPVPDALWALLADLLDKDPSRRPIARVASSRLRALQPELGELAALPAQDAPAEFAAAAGPPTELRGLTPPPPEPTAEPGLEPAAAAPLPDLGPTGQATMLRPVPTVPAPTPRTAAAATPPLPWYRRIVWRDPRVVAAFVVGALLIGAGVFWLTRIGDDRSGTVAPPPAEIRAQQQSPSLPTGLGISREATWDPQTGTARLSITYSAQRAPLLGPFLEVLPGAGGVAGCPAVQWSEVGASLNRPTVTGIDTPCGWAVEAPAVPARGSVTATATVPLVLAGTSPDAALQQWLTDAAAATEAATTDGEVTSTAYPVQRLTDVQVVAPDRTVSGKTLRISLLPEWPSGVDQLNPLFQSPPTGDPSSMLTAIAGGVSGVRFSDGCSGALSITNRGLVVVALSVSDSCQVGARVGNFTDLTSSPFTITTRGS